MPAIMQLESTLTDRYQTTVPESVRRALHLGETGSTTIRPDGRSYLHERRPAMATIRRWHRSWASGP